MIAFPAPSRPCPSVTVFTRICDHARALGDRPAVTAVAAAGRTELGWATFANWVAKTGNLLTEALDVQPGDDVVIELGLHWMGPVAACAAAAIGARPVASGHGVRVTGEDGGGDLVVGDGIGGRPLGAVTGLTISDLLAQPDDLLCDCGDPPDGRGGRALLAGRSPGDDDLLAMVDLAVGGGSLVLVADPGAHLAELAQVESVSTTW